jgi:DNA-binding CsgD family transcriptional regulator
MARRDLVRTVLIYGAALAAAAVGLQWLEFQFLARAYPQEIYVALIALAFLGIGVWAGARLSRSRATPDGAGFQRNDAAIGAIGLSPRELQVLERLAQGRSNKEIAAELSVSPNTVKTHLMRVYGKLEASRRTEALMKARELGILP